MFCVNDVREEKIKEIKKLVPSCRLCGNQEIKVLAMTSSSMPTMNETIDSVTHSYRPRYGALCMSCGHVEYFADFEKP